MSEEDICEWKRNIHRENGEVTYSWYETSCGKYVAKELVDRKGLPLNEKDENICLYCYKKIEVV